jgi:hypothetical protein
MSDGLQESSTIPEEFFTFIMTREIERRNVFEDVVAGENVFQFVGSANGHTTTARSVTAEASATQCLGDASDTTIQQISKDRSDITVNKEHPFHRGHYSMTRIT